MPSEFMLERTKFMKFFL